MSELRLSMAILDYDRVRALGDGRVRPEGIDLEIMHMEVEEIFWRQAKYAEFDVSEMSMSTYVLNMERETFPFVAIPVFPSRYFRHQSMFVRKGAGISSPADLRGKRIGVPEYQITAGVWQRGILQDEYGVTPSEIHWFSGGVEQPGREEKTTISLPPDVELTPIGNDQTLQQLLIDGELDALFTAHVPPILYEEDSPLVRLFPDFKSAEKEYFARTGIFPIMHVVVIRKSVLARDPWVARSLLKAFEASLEFSYADLMYRSALKTMLPWSADHVAETVAALGDRYWTYGIDENRHVLDTFLRYHHEQGLSPRAYTSDEIFAPSTAKSFTI